jgi:hypothetical protein
MKMPKDDESSRFGRSARKWLAGGQLQENGWNLPDMGAEFRLHVTSLHRVGYRARVIPRP